MAAEFDLLVCVGTTMRSYRLPHEGTWILGRADDAHVRIDDASVSRQHARLHVSDGFAIEDLGSANGTRVRAPPQGPQTADLLRERMPPNERVPIAVGQSVQLGTVTVVVRQGTADAGDTREPVVASASMRALFDMARRVAASPLSVLILGETGTGKEVLAEAIHRASPRAAQPLLRLHCAALSETLLESELFGHERGAFTGATAPKKGLLESAHGGTVFLDEVGELPLTTQVKLLRVLEERAVMRVGALRPLEIDVRFVSATHRDLRAEVTRGAFRQDLLFRLEGITLVIPPLRERADEIEPLARMFASRAASQLARATVPTFGPDALAALRAHSWPGNVRELRNVVDRAVVLAEGDIIYAGHLQLAPKTFSHASDPPPAPTSARPPAPEGFHEQVAALDRQRIIDALERCGGNQTRAAEMLGISRRTLVSRLEEYDLPRPRKGRG